MNEQKDSLIADKKKQLQIMENVSADIKNIYYQYSERELDGNSKKEFTDIEKEKLNQR